MNQLLAMNGLSLRYEYLLIEKKVDKPLVYSKLVAVGLKIIGFDKLLKSVKVIDYLANEV